MCVYVTYIFFHTNIHIHYNNDVVLLAISLTLFFHSVYPFALQYSTTSGTVLPVLRQTNDVSWSFFLGWLNYCLDWLTPGYYFLYTYITLVSRNKKKFVAALNIQLKSLATPSVRKAERFHLFTSKSIPKQQNSKNSNYSWL